MTPPKFLENVNFNKSAHMSTESQLYCPKHRHHFGINNPNKSLLIKFHDSVVLLIPGKITHADNFDSSTEGSLIMCLLNITHRTWNCGDVLKLCLIKYDSCYAS